eukprot:m.293864 g.293864  ORF g.293864 m.293864 type:complete len:500 (+) comp19498_c0_seq4:72-1571(+)
MFRDLPAFIAVLAIAVTLFLANDEKHGQAARSLWQKWKPAPPPPRMGPPLNDARHRVTTAEVGVAAGPGLRGALQRMAQLQQGDSSSGIKNDVLHVHRPADGSAQLTPKAASVFGDGYEVDSPLDCDPGGGVREAVWITSEQNPQGQQQQLESSNTGDGHWLCALTNRFDIAADLAATGGIDRRWQSTAKLLSTASSFRVSCNTNSTCEALGLRSLYEEQGVKQAASKFEQGSLADLESLTVDVFLPGAEVPFHTDAPTLLGAPSTHFPEWLQTVMLHSGIFDKRRVRHVHAKAVWPLNTQSSGMTFACLNGPLEECTLFETPEGTVVLLDAETVYHGHQASGSSNGAAPTPVQLHRNSKLRYLGNDIWAVQHDAKASAHDATYRSEELSVLVTWQFQLYRDQGEKQWAASVPNAQPSLVHDFVMPLTTDLRRREKFSYRDHLMHSKEPHIVSKLAKFFVQEYLVYPRSNETFAVPNPCWLLEQVPLGLGHLAGDWLGC